jgi:tetratricopeptide (TPR) repeat protein
LLELNQIEDHQHFAKESLYLLQKMKPTEYTAWAMTFIGFGYFLFNRQEVIENIQNVYQLFEGCNERRGMAIALAEWAGMLDTLHYETASEEAKAKLRQAIAWMEELNDQWMRARFLGNLARVHNFHGEYLRARDYLQEALEIFNELGENWPVIDVRFDLGQNATWLGNYDEAEEYFKSSLNFLRTVETGPYYGAHLDCLGYIEYLRENYDRAEAYYQESLSIYQRSHYSSGQVMDYNNLGDLARVRGNITQAIEYYRKGIGLLPTDSEYWARSIITKNLGNVMLDTGNLQLAERYLREAQHYARLVERVPDILDIDMSGAKLFAKRGNLEQAVEILAMILDNPASTQVVHTQVQALLGEISAEMPAQLVQSAIEKGKLLHPGCAFLAEDNGNE